MKTASDLREDVKAEREHLGWLASYKKKHGRAPRILHIGNIANNAYNNAKLLNKAGFDCDVICYDYYHIMGCPEWEDADFEDGIKHQFFPEWNSVDLKGFRRPDWFAQGPMELCLRYLISKRSGKRREKERYWRILALFNNTGDRKGGFWPGNIYRGPFKFLFNTWQRIIKLGRKENLAGSISGKLGFLNEKFMFLGDMATVFVFVALVPLVYVLKGLDFFSRKQEGDFFDERASSLEAAFQEVFPERADRLTASEIDSYRSIIPLWRKLFGHYDIIQGYSTDPILPLLAEAPYFAFEHGTLREIPFLKTSIGRMTALSYHIAEHVFVTNSDCIANARRLAGERFTFINHPYDEDHGVDIAGWQELRKKLCDELDSDFLFFFPTRHDWVPGKGYADKANDVFLNAFTRLRKEGFRVGMVLCRWGANVKESAQLLESGGCSKYARWEEPMGIIKFERTARACHVVADQFKLGAFGGVLFKAMAAGAPICTYLDEAKMREEYEEVPPVINCRTEDSIVSSMKKIMADTSTLKGISRASRDWIKKYYSSAETVRLQALKYREFLEKTEYWQEADI